MTQVGPVGAKTGTLVGMIIKISILFPFVLELWGYKSETAGGHLAIMAENLPGNRTIN